MPSPLIRLEREPIPFPAKFPPSDRYSVASGYDPADRLFKFSDGSLFPRINAAGAICAALKARRVK